MSKEFVFFCILVSAVILTSCRSADYRALVTHQGEGAMVRGQTNHHRITEIGVTVISVDGRYHNNIRQPDPFLVDPGARTLSVGAFTKSKRFSYRDYAGVDIQVTLLAGHAYEVKAERKGDEMTFWVLDTGSNESVGERKTTKVETLFYSGQLFL